MHTDFSSFGQYRIAQAELPETQVVGTGGATAPRLDIPLRLDVSHGAMTAQEGLELVSLAGKLFTNNACISCSTTISLGTILQQKFPRIQNELHYVEFPLDAGRVAALERQRNGADMKVRLDATLVVRQLFALGKTQEGIPPNTIWGQTFSQHLHCQAELSIPRDAWIARVLANVGFGVVHMLEFPAVPIESCAKLTHSFEALRKAQELHKIGLYDDAVAKCRVALDQFFELGKKVETAGGEQVVSRVPVLRRSWETRLGQAAYVWLGSALRAIKEAANPVHHSPSAHYDQLESLLILANTTAFVAYVARTIDTGETA
jgi:hypothetical protein